MSSTPCGWTYKDGAHTHKDVEECVDAGTVDTWIAYCSGDTGFEDRLRELIIETVADNWDDARHEAAHRSTEGWRS